MSSLESLKKSFAAYKGHFTRAVKAFELLLKVKPLPTMESTEKSYTRVQKQLDALFTSADNVISSLESSSADPENTVDIQKELDEINGQYDNLLSQQCDIEATYVNFKESCVANVPDHIPKISPLPLTSRSSNSNVRLTALEPPSWNGIKADFYTWKRKFIHIMEEARLHDELTKLCYLQCPRTLPLEYQQLISDCSTIADVWSRLEERIPKETIKYEIISQFRSIKPLSNRKTPEMLRDFANEISLFCRRMSDLGFRKENYSCIVFQDVYERLGHDITMRYRSKIELQREIMSVVQTRELEILQDDPRLQITSELYEDLDNICKFIRSEATTLELTTTTLQYEKSNFPKKLNIVQKMNDPKDHSQNDASVQDRFKCILGCENPHRLIDCSIYMNWDIERRRYFIKNSLRCYVCLVTSHTARNCSKKSNGSKCKLCSENNHHWALCNNSTSQNANNNDLNHKSTPFQPGAGKENSHGDVNRKSSGNLNNMALIYPNNDQVKPKDFSPMLLQK